MYGSLQEWVFQDLKGWRKFENFKILKTMLPEAGADCEYVFVGDTGELDKEAGMRMLTDRETSGAMRAIFMHVVAYGEAPPHVPNDSYINGKPIVYFRTYVGAALKATEHGLIDAQELRAVILQACDDLRASSLHPPSRYSTPSSSPRPPPVARSPGEATCADPKLPSKWHDLERDIGIAIKRFSTELSDLEIDVLNPLRAGKAKRSLSRFSEK
jgi:hypothetical protein